ncbi:MAG: formate dehydrogenase, alpha subunit [Betaproteobacteria bacterium]|jgi:anaerobic selenocysteine-containing dehydrogenase|nr:formate dehydrogenase, alpha subunit [Betaproteobacteria bacterium]
MQVSRREFLRLSLGGGSGIALAGLIASGVNLAPAVTRAQELRIKRAKTTPSICPYCSVGCATLVHTIDGQIVTSRAIPGALTTKVASARRALPFSSFTSIPIGLPRFSIAQLTTPIYC